MPSSSQPPRTLRALRRARAHARALALTTAALAALAGCAPLPAAPPTATPAQAQERMQALLPTRVLLLGEQHDAPAHQQLQRDTVRALAARGQLAALVLEMAERGRSTAGLPPDADEAQVRAALHWNDAAWPWQAYGPVVMAAVAAGVPVLGGNLPRADMRAAMQDTAWDAHLPPAALQRQYAALRAGHCGLLPEAQIAPMARIQIARDASMARTAQQAQRPGQAVLLVAGAGHVLRSMGIPTHWPADFESKVTLALTSQGDAAMKTEADLVVETAAPPPTDHCARLRQQWGK